MTMGKKSQRELMVVNRMLLPTEKRNKIDIVGLVIVAMVVIALMLCAFSIVGMLATDNHGANNVSVEETILIC